MEILAVLAGILIIFILIILTIYLINFVKNLLLKILINSIFGLLAGAIIYYFNIIPIKDPVLFFIFALIGGIPGIFLYVLLISFGINLTLF
jgi:hypothetical protein